jgi:hypothetical protein
VAILRVYGLLMVAALIAATIAAFRYTWIIWIPVATTFGLGALGLSKLVGLPADAPWNPRSEVVDPRDESA